MTSRSTPSKTLKILVIRDALYILFNPDMSHSVKTAPAVISPYLGYNVNSPFLFRAGIFKTVNQQAHETKETKISDIVCMFSPQFQKSISEIEIPLSKWYHDLLYIIHIVRQQWGDTRGPGSNLGEDTLFKTLFWTFGSTKVPLGA